jgi:aldehyde dehydrogenase (NAD+)
MTLREPAGVVGAVIPWNAPLVLFAQKAAPALAAGCTVVLKPSKYATFAVLRLARLIAQESGLPAGVLNVITGAGEPSGQALISWSRTGRSGASGNPGSGARAAGPPSSPTPSSRLSCCRSPAR